MALDNTLEKLGGGSLVTDLDGRLRVGGTAASTTGPAASAVTATAVAGAGTFTAATSSGSAVAANATRKGLQVVNNSANDVSLGLGTAAILNQGIVLKAAGGQWDGLVSGVLWRGAVNSIASVSSVVGYVEV